MPTDTSQKATSPGVNRMPQLRLSRCSSLGGFESESRLTATDPIAIALSSPPKPFSYTPPPCYTPPRSFKSWFLLTHAKSPAVERGFGVFGPVHFSIPSRHCAKIAKLQMARRAVCHPVGFCFSLGEQGLAKSCRVTRVAFARKAGPRIRSGVTLEGSGVTASRRRYSPEGSTKLPAPMLALTTPPSIGIVVPTT